MDKINIKDIWNKKKNGETDFDNQLAMLKHKADGTILDKKIKVAEAKNSINVYIENCVSNKDPFGDICGLQKDLDRANTELGHAKQVYASLFSE